MNSRSVILATLGGVLLVSVLFNVHLVRRLRDETARAFTREEHLQTRLDALQSARRQEAMRKGLERARAEFREDAESRLEKLSRLQRARGPRRILHELLGQTQEYPDSWRIRQSAGLLAYRLGRQRLAQQLLTQAVLAEPSAAPCFVLLFLSHDLTGEQARARFFADMAIESNPDGPYGFLGRAFLALDHPQESRSVHAFLRRAIDLAPRLSFGHMLLARLHLSQGQTTQARKSLAQALFLDPRLPQLADLESALSTNSK